MRVDDGAAGGRGHGAAPDPSGLAGVIRKSGSEARIRVDPLTQTLTPEGLADTLQIQYKSSRRVGILPTAILVSCEELGRLVTSRGAAVADALLRETALRLHAALRASDAVARVREDAFLLVLAETGYWEALRIAERVRERVTTPVPVATGEAVSFTPSIGVAAIPDAAMSVPDLLLLAQGALARSHAAEAPTQPGGATGRSSTCSPTLRPFG